MARRSLVLLVSILMGLFITTPTQVRAEEDTPADAPYQETIEIEAEPEQPGELQAEATTPTLPAVHNSPLTSTDPTRDPDVQASDYYEATPAVSQRTEATTETSVFGVRPVDLSATLTLRSIQNSRIWASVK